MPLNKYANTRDGNERDIITALEAVGASVETMDTPADLLVGYRKQTFLIEVKLPAGPKGGTSHSQQTKDQKEFAMTWRGHYAVCRTAIEALVAIGAVKPLQGGQCW